MRISEKIEERIDAASEEVRRKWFVSAVLVCGAVVVAIWVVFFSTIFSLEEKKPSAISLGVREKTSVVGGWVSATARRVGDFLVK
ncbi:MAG: hypothetical protein AAB495_00925 [Patescibacteria group bacterium]